MKIFEYYTRSGNATINMRHESGETTLGLMLSSGRNRVDDSVIGPVKLVGGCQHDDSRGGSVYFVHVYRYFIVQRLAKELLTKIQSRASLTRVVNIPAQYDSSREGNLIPKFWKILFLSVHYEQYIITPTLVHPLISRLPRRWFDVK